MKTKIAFFLVFLSAALPAGYVAHMFERDSDAWKTKAAAFLAQQEKHRAYAERLEKEADGTIRNTCNGYLSSTLGPGCVSTFKRYLTDRLAGGEISPPVGWPYREIGDLSQNIKIGPPGQSKLDRIILNELRPPTDGVYSEPLNYTPEKPDPDKYLRAAIAAFFAGATTSAAIIALIKKAAPLARRKGPRLFAAITACWAIAVLTYAYVTRSDLLFDLEQALRVILAPPLALGFGLWLLQTAITFRPPQGK